MLTTIVLSMSLAVVANGAQTNRPGPPTLQELTVPVERLPPGCILSRSNLAGLRIPSNPWRGTDRPLVASIRERIDGPANMPDGPPLSASEATRYRLHFADGVEEAYAAIYEQSSGELIVVYGFRLVSGEQRLENSERQSQADNPSVIRVAIGPMAAMVQGDGGPCFNVVGAHLTSLSK